MRMPGKTDFNVFIAEKIRKIRSRFFVGRIKRIVYDHDVGKTVRVVERISGNQLLFAITVEVGVSVFRKRIGFVFSGVKNRKTKIADNRTIKERIAMQNFCYIVRFFSAVVVVSFCVKDGFFTPGKQTGRVEKIIDESFFVADKVGKISEHDQCERVAIFAIFSKVFCPYRDCPSLRLR